MGALVCIVLINYNSFEDTVECVQSIMAQSYSNYRIIIVDNFSQDRDIIGNDLFLHSHCDVILSSSNNGFAAGNNIGIKFAYEKYDPDYYWILNNDTVVDQNCLSNLISRTSSYKENVGLITGRIMNYYERSKIDYRGGYFNYQNGVAGYYGTDESVHEDISFATGCFWLLPRKTIEKIGYLSEEYFMYAEDTDYCCRILHAGYVIKYCDEGIIYHKISASSGANSPFNQFYMTRNSLYIIKKYSKNTIMAYARFSVVILKDLAHKKRAFKPTLDAIVAFLHRELGRNEEY